MIFTSCIIVGIHCNVDGGCNFRCRLLRDVGSSRAKSSRDKHYVSVLVVHPFSNPQEGSLDCRPVHSLGGLKLLGFENSSSDFPTAVYCAESGVCCRQQLKRTSCKPFSGINRPVQSLGGMKLQTLHAATAQQLHTY